MACRCAERLFPRELKLRQLEVRMDRQCRAYAEAQVATHNAEVGACRNFSTVFCHPLGLLTKIRDKGVAVHRRRSVYPPGAAPHAAAATTVFSSSVRRRFEARETQAHKRMDHKDCCAAACRCRRLAARPSAARHCSPFLPSAAPCASSIWCQPSALRLWRFWGHRASCNPLPSR